MSENRIRYLRKLRKLTQVELAERLGVSHSAIQKLETGIVDLDTKWMQQLSIALDVKPYELLPLEWQPEEITPEEREMLRMVRKMAKPEAENNRHISPAQNTVSDTQQSPQPPFKTNKNGR